MLPYKFMVSFLSIFLHLFGFVLNQHRMEQQVAEIKSNINQEFSAQTEDMKSQFSAVDKKMKKIEDEVKTGRYPLGWKYMGRGYETSYTDYIIKYHTTFQQCVDFCEHKRYTDGVEWNGMQWYPINGSCYCYKNERGHVAGSHYMHFKTD